MTAVTKPRIRTAAKPSSRSRAKYVSLSVTKTLLEDSLTARKSRLAADDMVSTGEAAELAQTTRVTIKTWIDKGRCIGLAQTNRGYRLPRWQFEPRMWEALPKLAAALETRDGWALLSFLESPNGALNGLTPRVAIERGQGERVLKIASAEGY
jgi:hypothetical protein